MRHLTTAAAIVVFTVVAAAGFAQSSDVAKEIDETLEAIATATAEQREQARSQAKELITTLDSRIQILEAEIDEKSGELKGAAKRRLNRNVRQLKRQREQLAKRYQALREDTEQAWENIKSEFVEGVRTVTEKLDDAAAQLEEQMM
jgi:uncharacterized protein YukE